MPKVMQSMQGSTVPINPKAACHTCSEVAGTQPNPGVCSRAWSPGFRGSKFGRLDSNTLEGQINQHACAAY